MNTLHIASITSGLTVEYRALETPHPGSTEWVPKEDHLAAVAAERAIWTEAIEDYFDGPTVERVEEHVARIRKLKEAVLIALADANEGRAE